MKIECELSSGAKVEVRAALINAVQDLIGDAERAERSGYHVLAVAERKKAEEIKGLIRELHK